MQKERGTGRRKKVFVGLCFVLFCFCFSRLCIYRSFHERTSGVFLRLLCCVSLFSASSVPSWRYMRQNAPGRSSQSGSLGAFSLARVLFLRSKIHVCLLSIYCPGFGCFRFFLLYIMEGDGKVCRLSLSGIGNLTLSRVFNVKF